MPKNSFHLVALDNRGAIVLRQLIHVFQGYGVEGIGCLPGMCFGRSLQNSQKWKAGKRNDRPKLAEAMRAAKRQKATLVIAKLDRLARSVVFISQIMESGVEFVAVDLPAANRLTLHILAAVAEHEREMISQRTKSAR